MDMLAAVKTLNIQPPGEGFSTVIISLMHFTQDTLLFPKNVPMQCNNIGGHNVTIPQGLNNYIEYEFLVQSGTNGTSKSKINPPVYLLLLLYGYAVHYYAIGETGY